MNSKGYIVKMPKRWHWHETYRTTRKGSEDAFMEIMRNIKYTESWKHFYKKGYRIVKVEAVENDQ